MGWHDLAIGLLAFFIVLNTITIGLRVYIRTKLTKGAFGWDDIALIFTHVPNADRHYRYSAAIAAAMRLKTMFDPDPPPGHYARAYRVMIWSAVEHGLSIFASSVLALRPLIKLVPKGWTTLLGTIYRSGSAKSSGQGSSGHTPKKSNWSDPTDSPELGSVGNQNAISIRCEYKVDYCV
ncbi:hypothetical protein FJTKL_07304 [Diaporthe vaccinii]|uniref:Uncharacterized protein n=1 Tax=Diaporthe vaccinii TaxID=105482 RepID=A0ABR4EUE5_9PEZI